MSQQQRRIWYSVAMSLDGFIAGPAGEYDWIPNEVDIDWEEFVARFDTLLIGRKTFEMMQGQPPETQFLDKRRYLFTSTPDTYPGDVVPVSRGESIPVVRDLRAEQTTSSGNTPQIWLFGGGQLFASLLEAGLVDVIEVATIPVLLGTGLPLLPADYSPRKLNYVESKNCGAGIVMSRFDVVPLAGC